MREYSYDASEERLVPVPRAATVRDIRTSLRPAWPVVCGLDTRLSEPLGPLV